MKILKFLSATDNIIAILLAITMLSLSYPYGFPLVAPLTFLLLLLKSMNKNINLKIRINTGFILFFLLVVLYLLGMSMNQGIIYNHNRSDLINIITFFMFWILLSDLKKGDYPKILHKFSKLTVFLSFAVSFVSLYKFIMLINGVQIQAFFMELDYPQGSSLVRDYNMFVLGMSSGLVMSVYLISKSKKISHLLYYLSAFLLIFTSIIFSGSRRGWVLSIVLLTFVLYMGLKYILSHGFETNMIRLLKLSFVTTFIAFSLLLTSTVFNVDINFESHAITQLTRRLDSLQLDSVNDSFEDSRGVRWRHAEQLYGEYNPAEMIIGSGFSYLPDFGSTFDQDEENYPHSPMHSALLYSGLLGVVTLISFVLWTLYKAYIQHSTLGIYFLLLLIINFAFIAISSNSIFSSSSLMCMILLILSIPRNSKIPVED